MNVDVVCERRVRVRKVTLLDIYYGTAHESHPRWGSIKRKDRLRKESIVQGCTRRNFVQGQGHGSFKISSVTGYVDSRVDYVIRRPEIISKLGTPSNSVERV